MSKLIISSGQGCIHDFFEGTEEECDAILIAHNGIYVDENDFEWHLEFEE